MIQRGWVLLALVLPACSSRLTYERYIERVELASLSYRMQTIVSIKPAEVYEWEDVVQTVIMDRTDLDFIQSRLALAHPLPGYRWWDARIVGVIWWSNNTHDTLIFGGPYQGYGNQPYRLDSLLLRRIAGYLPPAHQEEIDYYIRVHLPGVRWDE